MSRSARQRSMKILFLHQNFPGQFRHVAPALVSLGHQVLALGVEDCPVAMPGVRYFRHRPVFPATPNAAPGKAAPSLLAKADFDSKVCRGESASLAMLQLQQEGFCPDVVFAHPGWGEALFVKSLFPAARLLIYAEYYYGAPQGDTAFDPEFSTPSLRQNQRITLKNSHLLHALSECDQALSPTRFQRSQHPAWAQPKISVIHDGIDTTRFRPDPAARVTLRSAGITLRAGDEVITFVARQLEPYRGYHIFMRALPLLQQLRPQARIVIVGADGASYGAVPPSGQTWKQIFHAEVQAHLDAARIHFVGRVPHGVLTQLLQISAVHVYLTYPFVLSWSLLEAMSIGCLVVASDTAPVREVIEHGRTGLLTDFFDPAALARTVAHALDQQATLKPLRLAARQAMLDQYDLHTHCLPRQLDFICGT